VDDLQLPSYALTIFENHKVEDIELCFEDLSEGQTLVNHFVRDSLEKVRKELLSEIRQINQQDRFQTTPSVLCKWCGYNNLCPDPHPSVREVSYNLPSVKPRREKQQTCPECGAALQERRGRFGPFIGCSRFPECRYTRNQW
jgi:hypothetical protein